MTIQPICVHLRSSAVRDFDIHSLHRIPIGAPGISESAEPSKQIYVQSSNLWKTPPSAAPHRGLGSQPQRRILLQTNLETEKNDDEKSTVRVIKNERSKHVKRIS